MGFSITSDTPVKHTQIPNEFIHKYMLNANGNFVKIYLYLLMAYQHPDEVTGLTIGTMADLMECTENDIIRAFRYWKKNGLLSIIEENNEIVEVSILTTAYHDDSLSAATEEKKVEKPVDEPVDVPSASAKEPNIVEKEHPIPAKQTYTPLQAEALQKDIAIDNAIATVEKLLGAPVSPSHLQLILYFMCDIGFSSDLLVTLYATAISKGKNQPSYIEAIGINWAKKGITTPAQAEEETANFSGKYALVSKALGINRNLAPAEKNIIDSWESYKFSNSVITEACKRTVLQTGDTNFNYISKILEDWHKKNVISLQDIEKIDESYKKQKKNHTTKPNGNSKNQFQNFPQRSYSKGDYDSLEKQLLRG